MQTEENKTAAELRQKLAELKRRLKEMEAAYDHSCNGISIVDSIGKIIHSTQKRSGKKAIGTKAQRK